MKRRRKTANVSDERAMRFAAQYVALKAETQTAFGRWAAATPAAANAARTEYYAALEALREHAAAGY